MTLPFKSEKLAEGEFAPNPFIQQGTERVSPEPSQEPRKKRRLTRTERRLIETEQKLKDTEQMLISILGNFTQIDQGLTKAEKDVIEMQKELKTFADKSLTGLVEHALTIIADQAQTIQSQEQEIQQLRAQIAASSKQPLVTFNYDELSRYQQNNWGIEQGTTDEIFGELLPSEEQEKNSFSI